MSLNVLNTDDYASLWDDEFDAYYGYEVTSCPNHEDSEACDNDDCEDMEWCFRFTKGETEIIFTKTEIEEAVPDVEGRMPSSYLMAGIGMLFNDGFLLIR
jgi:hypothetical protein